VLYCLENEETSEIQGSEESLIFRSDAGLLGVRIAPGEGKQPLSLFQDVDAEVMSFPTIYGGTRRKFKVRVSYTDIAKSELRRYDRRACLPSKLLYSFKKSFNEKVQQAVQVCMKKTARSSELTASEIKSPGFVDNLLKKDEGYAVFKNIRSSPSYWKSQIKRVMAMLRTEGKCTFFITLSSAESKWTELLVNVLLLTHLS